MRFFQARIALFTIVLAAGGRGPRNPSDFCAVQLLATDSARGQPVVSGVAELIASSGRVTQTKKVINGRVEFCDFGFGEYSILIHYERSQCAATEIKNIHVVYGFTQQLSAVLNSCVDEADVGPGTMCPTYVRVSSHDDGAPLSKVEVKYDPTRYRYSAYTDTYGRVLLHVEVGTKGDFTFLKPGYKPGHLKLTCPPNSGGVGGTKEASVVLQPEDRQKK